MDKKEVVPEGAVQEQPISKNEVILAALTALKKELERKSLNPENIKAISDSLAALSNASNIMHYE